MITVNIIMHAAGITFSTSWSIKWWETFTDIWSYTVTTIYTSWLTDGYNYNYNMCAGVHNYTITCKNTFHNNYYIHQQTVMRLMRERFEDIIIIIINNKTYNYNESTACRCWCLGGDAKDSWHEARSTIVYVAGYFRMVEIFVLMELMWIETQWNLYAMHYILSCIWNIELSSSYDILHQSVKITRYIYGSYTMNTWVLFTLLHTRKSR